ncbi:putative expansin-B2 [Ipomoea triloba]|uniref:putative expansin-B2 n=1 Tax=Ipomoea triloba TaxID=35885 RepID=UPI00125D1390|nr:putative expansin-B2 [Ipomoea triloba]
MVYFIIYLVILSVFSVSCSSSNLKLFNLSKLESDNRWSPAGATWYGPPNGAGSNGGACGYGSTVEQPPFSSFVSAGGPSLFKSGKGCGACYEVKCTANKACSGKPIRVVITDECPGCVKESTHFDLSVTAFGAMAVSGKSNQLRAAGELKIQYKRAECHHRGKTLTFRVDPGSNPFYFAAVIQYAQGDGNIVAVQLKQGNSGVWTDMKQSWGAMWKLNSRSRLNAPFSLKVTGDSGKSVVAGNVIPAGWRPGGTYRSG